MREYLPGGKGDGIPRRKFSKKQLCMGRKVEMEHTNNPRIAEEIARDHLAEFKDYYTRLARMERQAKRAGVKGVKESLQNTDKVFMSLLEANPSAAFPKISRLRPGKRALLSVLRKAFHGRKGSVRNPFGSVPAHLGGLI